MKAFQKSMLTLGTAVAIGGLAAACVPALAVPANPCAPKASPCSAKAACAAMPMHHRKKHVAMANPCAARMAPCAAKKKPCAAH